MNGNFSKWNKRITIWLLLLAGFYMGYMEYSMEYLLIFLGSGLTAMGMTIFGKSNGVIKDNPPPELEEHDNRKKYYVNDHVLYDDKEWIAIQNNGPGEFITTDWVCIT
jgi:hypothetical protein